MPLAAIDKGANAASSQRGTDKRDGMKDIEPEVLFKRLIAKAKQMQGACRYKAALKYYTKAVALFSTPKLEKRIEKLNGIIDSLVPLEDGFVDDPNTGCCVLDESFFLSQNTYTKLYKHQREGVKWLWSLFKNQRGGILADDMGLGKTVQISAYLDGLFASELIHSALIVMPVSVAATWKKELAFWAPTVNVQMFHGTRKAARKKALHSVMEEGGVCLTTYGMVLSSTAELNQDDHTWDYVILDEGHKIRNHTSQTAKAIRDVNADNRLILSGTPIQNKLAELWALFDFVCFGSLLGSRRTFTLEFENIIVRGSDRHASNYHKLEAQEVAKTLRELIQPHFLRREKKKILGGGSKDQTTAQGAVLAGEVVETSPARNQPTADSDLAMDKESGHTSDTGAEQQQLPPKDDFVMWVKLSELQEEIYNHFLSSQRVRDILNSTKSPLAALTIMKKLCDHPRLLRGQEQYHVALGLRNAASEDDGLKQKRHRHHGSSGDGNRDAASDSADDETPGIENLSLNDAAVDVSHSQLQEGMSSVLDQETVDAIFCPRLSARELVQQSGKLRFCIQLLRQLKREGHRVLIFSHSLKMLDMISAVLNQEIITHSRLHGAISGIDERQQIVDDFNRDDSISCMLLTTQVGGVGLTLTGADRVIIFDPSWNPSTDAQAVDRAYRIGQTRRVVVYRLITCGTIEEKIYRKQVFKDGLSRVATTSSDPYRYFTKNEIKALFKLENTQQSETYLQLEATHGKQIEDDELERHLSALACHDLSAASNHALLFSKADKKEAVSHHEAQNARNSAADKGERLRRECTQSTRKQQWSKRVMDDTSNDSSNRDLPNALEGDQLKNFEHDTSNHIAGDDENAHGREPGDNKLVGPRGGKATRQILSDHERGSDHEVEPGDRNSQDQDEAEYAGDRSTTNDSSDVADGNNGLEQQEKEEREMSVGMSSDNCDRAEEQEGEEQGGDVGHDTDGGADAEDEVPFSSGNESSASPTVVMSPMNASYRTSDGEVPRSPRPTHASFLERYQGASIIMSQESCTDDVVSDDVDSDDVARSLNDYQDLSDDTQQTTSDTLQDEEEDSFYTPAEQHESSDHDNAENKVEEGDDDRKQSIKRKYGSVLTSPAGSFEVDGRSFASPEAFIISPRAAAAAPTCSKHRSKEVHVQRCRCHVFEKDFKQYQRLVCQARRKASSDPHTALEQVLGALELCSDDGRVHCMALKLARKLRIRMRP